MTQVYLETYHFIEGDSIVLNIDNFERVCLTISDLNTEPSIINFNFVDYQTPDSEIEYYTPIIDVNSLTEMLLKVVDVLTDEQLNILIKHNIHLDKLIHNHPNT